MTLPVEEQGRLAGRLEALDAIVIGASTGALDALARLLPALPAGFGPAVLVAVHLPPAAPSLFPELLGPSCRIPVREALDKEPLSPGAALFAPPDYHLLVEEDGSAALSVDPPRNFSRPAIDPLFESAAIAFGARLGGIVLTGGSEDGAEGLHAVHARGGLAIVEDPATAAAAAMPRAALARCPGATALPLDDLVAVLARCAPRAERAEDGPARTASTHPVMGDPA